MAKMPQEFYNYKYREELKQKEKKAQEALNA